MKEKILLFFNQKEKRFRYSVKFTEKYIDKSEKITDLGEPNKLADMLLDRGYRVTNTSPSCDLDYGSKVATSVITSFEIFEHMFAPFNFLMNNKGKLIVSVPLNVWFSPEYWNYKDKRDCHYHEFSVRQFNHLLDRTGWYIVASEKTSFFKFGIRPILRLFWPSYYFVYAVKG